MHSRIHELENLGYVYTHQLHGERGTRAAGRYSGIGCRAPVLPGGTRGARAGGAGGSYLQGAASGTSLQHAAHGRKNVQWAPALPGSG